MFSLSPNRDRVGALGKYEFRESTIVHCGLVETTSELDVPVVLITSVDSKSINRSHFRTDLFDLNIN